MSDPAVSVRSGEEGYPDADDAKYADSSSGTYPDSLWRNENFLRLLFGRLVTNAGDSLYAVAAMWLVHDLTGSTVYTGLASSLMLLPRMLQFVAGPLVDRWRIVRTLVGIQLVQAVAILSLPLAAHTGNLTVELLLVLIPFLALLNQFVYPAQSAALPRVVADYQLTRGNSAFAFANNGLDMLFEALGGVLIALVGTASLFVLDSFSFLLAAFLFVGVRLPAPDDPGDDAGKFDVSGYLADMVEGFDSLRGTVFVETTAMAATTNFGVGMTLAVLPRFAAIRSGPSFYGLMLAALGTGIVLGSALAARLEHVKYGHLKVVGFVASCLLWLGAVYAPWPPLAVGLFALAWVPPGVSNVMGSTLIQTVTPKRLLGRVSAVTSSGSSLTLPIGALIGGLVGHAIGAVSTMAVGGVLFGLVAIYFALRPPLRRLPAMNDIDPAAFDVGETGSSTPDRSE